MKKTIVLLGLSIYLSFNIYGQAPKVDIEGSSRIVGALEIIKSIGDSSIYIGANAGINDDGMNNNLFIGTGSGQDNSVGFENTLIGMHSGLKMSNGFKNTTLGFNSGRENLFGDDNLFAGHNSGRSNSRGNRNTFVGSRSGMDNDFGDENVFLGYSSGKTNTRGVENVFIGTYSGKNNISGGNNTFIGFNAGEDNSEASFNQFIGSNAGKNNETGENNVFVGYGAGFNNTTASNNVFVGDLAGLGNNGEHNTFIGYQAGKENIDGFQNVFVGNSTGASIRNGIDNTFIGRIAGESLEKGLMNTFIGGTSGRFITKGSGNTFIGHGAGQAELFDTLYNSVALGHNVLVGCNLCISIGGSNSHTYKTGVGETTPKTALHIKQISQDFSGGLRLERSDNEVHWDFYVAPNSSSLVFAYNNFFLGSFISSSNGSYNILSDSRLKENVHPLEDQLEKIALLRPTSYELIRDETDQKQIGFIAQEIQQLFPELVHQHEDYLSLNYDGFSVLAIQGIKDLLEKNKSLEKEYAELEERTSSLELYIQRILRSINLNDPIQNK